MPEKRACPVKGCAWDERGSPTPLCQGVNILPRRGRPITDEGRELVALGCLVRAGFDA